MIQPLVLLPERRDQLQHLVRDACAAETVRGWRIPAIFSTSSICQVVPFQVRITVLRLLVAPTAEALRAGRGDCRGEDAVRVPDSGAPTGGW